MALLCFSLLSRETPCVESSCIQENSYTISDCLVVQSACGFSPHAVRRNITAQKFSEFISISIWL